MLRMLILDFFHLDASGTPSIQDLMEDFFTQTKSNPSHLTLASL